VSTRTRTARHWPAKPSVLPQPDEPPVLPRPPHWTEAAVCATVDAEIFYPAKGGSVAYAKKVCATCPVTDACLEYGIGDPHGVYGGKSAPERERIRLERAIAAGDLPTERHCQKGLHVLDAANTYGTGRCRACKRAADRARTATEARPSEESAA
jgi:hypothetical protein